ncbi:MAG: response regulator [Ardenticatenaceae bacterium]
MAKILVVDDSPVIQRMLSFTLKRHRHTVLTARHGKQALQLLEKRQVDLVITDVTMPQMDGLTLLKELRANADYKSLPVVMLTASGQERDRMNAEAEGANGFLTKPTSSRQLIETVNKVLA